MDRFIRSQNVKRYRRLLERDTFVIFCINSAATVRSPQFVCVS